MPHVAERGDVPDYSHRFSGAGGAAALTKRPHKEQASARVPATPRMVPAVANGPQRFRQPSFDHTSPRNFTAEGSPQSGRHQRRASLPAHMVVPPASQRQVATPAEVPSLPATDIMAGVSAAPRREQTTSSSAHSLPAGPRRAKEASTPRPQPANPLHHIVQSILLPPPSVPVTTPTPTATTPPAEPPRTPAPPLRRASRIPSHATSSTNSTIRTHGSIPSGGAPRSSSRRKRRQDQRGLGGAPPRITVPMMARPPLQAPPPPPPPSSFTSFSDLALGLPPPPTPATEGNPSGVPAPTGPATMREPEPRRHSRHRTLPPRWWLGRRLLASLQPQQQRTPPPLPPRPGESTPLLLSPARARSPAGNGLFSVAAAASGTPHPAPLDAVSVAARHLFGGGGAGGSGRSRRRSSLHGGEGPQGVAAAPPAPISPPSVSRPASPEGASAAGGRTGLSRFGALCDGGADSDDETEGCCSILPCLLVVIGIILGMASLWPLFPKTSAIHATVAGSERRPVLVSPYWNRAVEIRAEAAMPYAIVDPPPSNPDNVTNVFATPALPADVNATAPLEVWTYLYLDNNLPPLRRRVRANRTLDVDLGHGDAARSSFSAQRFEVLGDPDGFGGDGGRVSVEWDFGFGGVRPLTLANETDGFGGWPSLVVLRSNAAWRMWRGGVVPPMHLRMYEAEHLERGRFVLEGAPGDVYYFVFFAPKSPWRETRAVGRVTYQLELETFDLDDPKHPPAAKCKLLAARPRADDLARVQRSPGAWWASFGLPWGWGDAGSPERGEEDEADEEDPYRCVFDLPAPEAAGGAKAPLLPPPAGSTPGRNGSVVVLPVVEDKIDVAHVLVVPPDAPVGTYGGTGLGRPYAIPVRAAGGGGVGAAASSGVRGGGPAHRAGASVTGGMGASGWWDEDGTLDPSAVRATLVMQPREATWTAWWPLWMLLTLLGVSFGAVVAVGVLGCVAGVVAQMVVMVVVASRRRRGVDGDLEEGGRRGGEGNPLLGSAHAGYGTAAAVAGADHEEPLPLYVPPPPLHAQRSGSTTPPPRSRTPSPTGLVGVASFPPPPASPSPPPPVPTPAVARGISPPATRTTGYLSADVFAAPRAGGAVASFWSRWPGWGLATPGAAAGGDGRTEGEGEGEGEDVRPAEGARGERRTVSPPPYSVEDPHRAGAGSGF
ncbi:hypothetical protein HDU96_008937 [Phlyctochytrium bullatum]|nr:hypothetical protein HDU96_008937 [Phlyctochytrium bullatum]